MKTISAQWGLLVRSRQACKSSQRPIRSPWSCQVSRHWGLWLQPSCLFFLFVLCSKPLSLFSARHYPTILDTAASKRPPPLSTRRACGKTDGKAFLAELRFLVVFTARCGGVTHLVTVVVCSSRCRLSCDDENGKAFARPAA